MKTLLGYIGKERHADSLVEKLMLRFEAAVSEDQWKNLAFCLTQVCHTSSHATSVQPDLQAQAGEEVCALDQPIDAHRAQGTRQQWCMADLIRVCCVRTCLCPRDQLYRVSKVKL